MAHLEINCHDRSLVPMSTWVAPNNSRTKINPVPTDRGKGTGRREFFSPLGNVCHASSSCQPNGKVTKEFGFKRLPDLADLYVMVYIPARPTLKNAFWFPTRFADARKHHTLVRAHTSSRGTLMYDWGAGEKWTHKLGARGRVHDSNENTQTLLGGNCCTQQARR
jgi:hypothetical protein